MERVPLQGLLKDEMARVNKPLSLRAHISESASRANVPFLTQ